MVGGLQIPTRCGRLCNSRSGMCADSRRSSGRPQICRIPAEPYASAGGRRALAVRHYAIATDKDDGTAGSEETASCAAKLTAGSTGGSLRSLYVHGYWGGIVFANSSTHLKTERAPVWRGSFKAIEFNKLTEHRKAVRNLRDLGRPGFSAVGNDPSIRHR